MFDNSGIEASQFVVRLQQQCSIIVDPRTLSSDSRPAVSDDDCSTTEEVESAPQHSDMLRRFAQTIELLLQFAEHLDEDLLQVERAADVTHGDQHRLQICRCGMK